MKDHTIAITLCAVIGGAGLLYYYYPRKQRRSKDHHLRQYYTKPKKQKTLNISIDLSITQNLSPDITGINDAAVKRIIENLMGIDEDSPNIKKLKASKPSHTLPPFPEQIHHLVTIYKESKRPKTILLVCFILIFVYKLFHRSKVLLVSVKGQHLNIW